VSVNAAAGVSVFTYTGNAAASATLGHGLGSVPELVCFAKTGSSSAFAGGSIVGAGKYLQMSLTSAATNSSTTLVSYQPTTITVGSTLTSAVTTVGYALVSVPGVTKIGTVSGDGSGVLSVDCGFQPRTVWFKTTVGTGNFTVYYRAGNTTGYASFLYMNTNAAEGTSTTFQITANGFSLDAASAGNNGTTTAVYMAWA